MFSGRFQLFRLFGIPIRLDLTWLIILALLTWTMAGVYRLELPEQTPRNIFFFALITALAFFGCIVLHEMGHALVARSSGMGIRGITLFMFGGVAELSGEPQSARSEFYMAIAGPIVSLILAACFWLGWYVGAALNWPPGAILFCFYLAWINSVVFIFNLVPAFPLDGGRVLRSILWGATNNLHKATYWASLSGRAFAWFLIAVGMLELFAGNFAGGLWMGLIGWFLYNAAYMSYQQLQVREALQGEPLRRFMTSQPITVPESTGLTQWIEDYVYRYHWKSFPVVSNGHLRGMVSTQELMKIPRQDWDTHSVGDIMQVNLDNVRISPNADTLQALEKMQRCGTSRLLVTEGDRLVGVVSLRDLLKFIQLKMELANPREEE